MDVPSAALQGVEPREARVGRAIHGSDGDLRPVRACAAGRRAHVTSRSVPAENGPPPPALQTRGRGRGRPAPASARDQPRGGHAQRSREHGPFWQGLHPGC